MTIAQLKSQLCLFGEYRIGRNHGTYTQPIKYYSSLAGFVNDTDYDDRVVKYVKVVPFDNDKTSWEVYIDV